MVNISRGQHPNLHFNITSQPHIKVSNYWISLEKTPCAGCSWGFLLQRKILRRYQITLYLVSNSTNNPFISKTTG